MAQQTDAAIEGTTTEHTTGKMGDPGCDEAMHVVHEGEDIYVPWTNVKKSAYDWYEGVPETIDVDRIIVYDGHIHAEADVEGGVVEVAPDYNNWSAEFVGYDSWTLQFFDDPVEGEGTIVYERE